MSDTGCYSGVSALGGALGLTDLFPREWMCEHTEFEDIQSFIAAGDDAPEQHLDGSTDEWDDHVSSTTQFEDWGEMLGCALDEYHERRSATNESG